MSSCYVTCPAALPSIVTIPGADGTGVPVGAVFAYGPSHTNYFGATGCSLRSGTKPCTLPTTIAGKGTNFITPIVWVPRTKTTGTSKQTSTQVYTCDPIAAATANAQNFKFVCSGLPGKDLNHGSNTLRWAAAQAGSILTEQRIGVGPLSSTPFYVLDAAKATATTTTPTTYSYTTLTGSTTFTRTAKTVFVSVTTGTTTSTCTGTVTVFVTASAAGGPNLAASPTSSASSTTSSLVAPSSSSSTSISSFTPSAARPTSSAKRIQRHASEPSGEYDASLHPNETSLTSLTSNDRPSTSTNSPNINDPVPYLELRSDASSAETDPDWPREQQPHMRIKRAPTLGKPDATYPPYGESTVFVKSIHTSTKTIDHISSFTEWPTPATVTSTTSVLAFTIAYANSTVTVTSTVTR